MTSLRQLPSLSWCLVQAQASSPVPLFPALAVRLRPMKAIDLWEASFPAEGERLWHCWVCGLAQKIIDAAAYVPPPPSEEKKAKINRL